jgi:hypothetical protein
MNASPLAVDRIEFLKFRVRAMPTWNGKADKSFPQLSFDMNNVVFGSRSSLDYGDDQLSDPRHFTFHFGLRLLQNEQTGTIQLPYEIEAETVVFLRFEGDGLPQPLERFKLIRANGYPIAYAAIREMVCSFTGRSSHGVWQLPSANFTNDAKLEAQQDERVRCERLLTLAQPALKAKKRKTKAVRSVEDH